MAACGQFVLIYFFSSFLSVLPNPPITRIITIIVSRKPTITTSDNDYKTKTITWNNDVLPGRQCWNGFLQERRLLLSNSPQWNKDISTICVKKTGNSYWSESIRVSRNEVEIINKHMCDSDQCNSRVDWFTMYCPQSFNVKVSWYLQTSNQSYLTCLCNTCNKGVCKTDKPKGCGFKRNGLINIVRSCTEINDDVIYSVESSTFDSEYQDYKMTCNFSDYCNIFSASEIKEFVCPAMFVNQLRLPDLENFPASSKSDNRQCESDNEMNGHKCSLSNTQGFCFKYLIKFLLRPMLKVYKSEECDDNIEQKYSLSICNKSRSVFCFVLYNFCSRVFDMQRTIYYFTTGRLVVKWECGKSNCMTDYNQTHIYHCLNGIHEYNPTLSLKRGMCRCTSEGMEPDLAKFCIDGLCSRDNIVQEFEIYSDYSFFCSNFGNERYGCYFKNSQTFGALFIDELTYSGKEKTRRMLCAISKCNKRLSINALFGCNDTDDQLFGPTDDSDKPSSKPPHSVSVHPDEILGPVGAVVVIFLTVIIGIVFIINTVVVCKVQRKWRRDDKLKEECARKRRELSQEQTETQTNCNAKKMCQKSSPKKSPPSSRDRLRSSRNNSMR